MARLAAIADRAIHQPFTKAIWDIFRQDLNYLAVAGADIAALGANNAVPVTSEFHTVTVASGNIDNITDVAGLTKGQPVRLLFTNSQTIRNNGGGVGNIRTLSGADFTVGANAVVEFSYDGANWRTSDPAANLPWLIDVDVYGTAIANTNWNTISQTSAVLYAGYKISSGAQNDEINWDLVLAAGTWTVEIIYGKGSDVGIFSVQLDGVEKGTIDGYSAGGGTDQRSSVAGIVVATTGKTRLKLKMTAKNASASSYYGRIQHVQLRRTA